MSISVKLSIHVPADRDNLLVDMMVIDWTASWRPAQEFWGRLTKADILELATQFMGEDWVAQYRGEKKATLVERLSDIMDGKTKPADKATKAAIDSWSPPSFAPDSGDEVIAS